MEIIKRVTDYAMRGLIFMAKSSDQKVFDLTTVSRETDTPLPFLQKIFRKLSQAGLLTTHRGINGGFSFQKKVKEISILEIIEIVQGPLTMNQCFSSRKDDQCPREKTCGFRSALCNIDGNYRGQFKNISLQDLVDTEISAS